MLLYQADDFEFARFKMPQIKRLQRLIYMSRRMAHSEPNDSAKIQIIYDMAKYYFHGISKTTSFRHYYDIGR